MICVRPFVCQAQGTPLYFETVWTGELLLKTNLCKWQNLQDSLHKEVNKWFSWIVMDFFFFIKEETVYSTEEMKKLIEQVNSTKDLWVIVTDEATGKIPRYLYLESASGAGAQPWNEGSERKWICWKKMSTSKTEQEDKNVSTDNEI